MYTLVNPSFTIQKWGSRGSKLYWYVFVMESFEKKEEETFILILELSRSMHSVDSLNRRYRIQPNYCTVRLCFSRLLKRVVVKYPPKKGTLYRKISRGLCDRHM